MTNLPPVPPIMIFILGGGKLLFCHDCLEEMLSDFEGKRMIANYFGHSGNDLKSGKLSSGMGSRFHPESVAGLGRNLQFEA